MNRMPLKIIRPILVLLPLFTVGCGSDWQPGGAKVDVIPLEEIWAYEMPGTRDVRELEPEHFGMQVRDLSGEKQLHLLHTSLTQKIRDSLDFLRSEENKQARPGFAVSGTANEALRHAHAVLAKKEKARNTFSADKDVSIVFFSHLFGDYVHLEEVDKRGKTIRISYRFVPHATKNMSQHFAIIPLGRLRPGNYQVEIRQLPIRSKFVTESNRYVPSDIVRRIVCKPFEFSVIQPEETNGD